MKMIIERTSMWDGKPCKEAERMRVPYWHIRTCTEDEFNRKFSSREGRWKSKGKNHKKVSPTKGRKKSWIARQEKDEDVWGIEIKSLEDILDLVEKYGDIIIDKYKNYVGKDKIYIIEIYDTYRE